jgi:AraC-like DNA-binding protein
MSSYSPAAWERAMRVREVILQAIAGKMTWIQAADVLGMSPRTVRRWRYRLQHHGLEGLIDRRHCSPSERAIPEAELQRWLRLYRDRYRGYNARHFWVTCRREHGLTWSYTLLRTALQAAGLVRKHRPRGRHFRRREPRACFGEMLHLDGSRHRWLALCPEDYQHLIVVVDDATGKILYARLEEGESSTAVMTALGAVFRAHGLPQALYTDRASWAACTRSSEGRPREDRPTQVQRALQALGVEHIHAFTPQARGRSERVNRTLQDRLVNELRVHGIHSVGRANRYLNEHFLPAYNAEFARAPSDASNGFAPLLEADLDAALCHEEQRQVAKDNTVQLDGVRLQIEKQPGRVTCAGLTVTIRRHLDGTHSITWGKRLLGRYDSKGRRLEIAVLPASSTEAAA